VRLEPGMRVRCVDDSAVSWALTAGRNYTVESAGNEFIQLYETDGMTFDRSRFKPVVRVKMGRAAI
jgi:hypothetical protein